MTMRLLRALLISVCLLGMGAWDVSAQTPAVQSDALGWDMKQDTSGLTFQSVIDEGTPQTLSGVTCGPLNNGISVCRVSLPAMTPGVHTIQIVAIQSVAGQAIQSAPSAPLSVSFIAVVTPENVRIVKG